MNKLEMKLLLLKSGSFYRKKIKGQRISENKWQATLEDEFHIVYCSKKSTLNF
jgi:hypothetical protein